MGLAWRGSCHFQVADLFQAESSLPIIPCIQTLNICLVFLEAGKSKMQALAGLVPGEGPLPGSQPAISSRSQHGSRGEGLSGASFIRALFPFRRALPL